MAQYKITIGKENLHQLFNRDQGMVKLVGKVINEILEAGVTEKLRVGSYERSEGRQGYRNGYRRLRGVEMITFDDHGGLVKAIRRHFQGFPGKGARPILNVIF